VFQAFKRLAKEMRKAAEAVIGWRRLRYGSEATLLVYEDAN
jgi:hypothetical protein